MRQSLTKHGSMGAKIKVLVPLMGRLAEVQTPSRTAIMKVKTKLSNLSQQIVCKLYKNKWWTVK